MRQSPTHSSRQRWPEVSVNELARGATDRGSDGDEVDHMTHLLHSSHCRQALWSKSGNATHLHQPPVRLLAGPEPARIAAHVQLAPHQRRELVRSGAQHGGGGVVAEAFHNTIRGELQRS